MANQDQFSKENNNIEVLPLLKKILKSEAPLFWMSAIYTIAIGLLFLAVPLSVQFLINSVSSTAMLQPAITLGLVLLGLLLFWAILNALQFFVTEIFQRRFFARMAAEISISLLKSKRQNSATINHFFEIVTVKKTIPKFLTKTFSTILHGLVGLVLVSFYHPVFFLFSIVLVILMWLIWSQFYKKAIFSACQQSKTKYDLVNFFDKIVEDNQEVNLETEKEVNHLIGDYLQNRKRHFAPLFTQVILLLSLYVIASVSLLILGSWLVIKNQLTLGQLVAAELILSTTLYNFSQLGRDFENFYDLVASCEKLSKFYNFSFEEKDFKLFTNLKNIALPKPLKILPKIILIFVFCIVIILIFTPWQQTSKGFGHAIANDPNDRMQNINAPVSGRIKKWHVQDGSVVKKGDILVEIVDNDPLILDRIKSERDAKKRKLQVSQIASETSKLNYQRQEELFNKGLSARKDFEEAKIEYKKLLSSEESAASDLAEAETKLARQQNQIIYSPKDGVVMRVLAGDIATTVKAGDKIATFTPNLEDPAIEVYIDGNDIPFVKQGRKVRIQFEGWPIIQFSGWPSIAVGTFGGVVSSVDSSISDNGKFRVIIKKPSDEEWPDMRFLKHGSKAKAWILLNRVSLGYEFWRQLNRFPPQFDVNIKSSNEVKDEHHKKTHEN